VLVVAALKNQLKECGRFWIQCWTRAYEKFAIATGWENNP